MPTYKFKIGQTVFVEAVRNSNFPAGAYIITQRMPERDGELEYRVRRATSRTNASCAKVN